MSDSKIYRDDLFVGKTAFISGGTSGINLGISKALASVGAQVAILGRDAEKADKAAAEISALGPEAFALTADVRHYADLSAAAERAAARLGGFDFVIAGAAGNFIAGAEALSPNGFKAVVEIDLNGTFHMFKSTYAHLRRPGASMIAISAGQAQRASWGQVHAAAAKAGVEALVKGLALEWGPSGIRVNGLCPGAIEATEGVDRLITPERAERLRKRLPIRRYGTKAEIGDAAIFLLSDAASYITGTILTCDGGMMLVSDDTQPEAEN